MSNEMFGFRKAAPWIPFGFCVFLCGLVLVMLMSTGKVDNAYPAFFCFLPMTFFFVAVAVSQARKEIKQLSDRIDQLEGKAK